ncbi:MAG: hypothetical protein AABX53_03270 [Nanoarchaeota archaeon]
MSLKFTSGQDHVLSARGVYKVSQHERCISLREKCRKEPNVSLMFFLQYSSCNTQPAKTRRNLFERIESKVFAEARRHEVVLIMDVSACPVGKLEGYSDEGYLVTAQGYQAQSTKRI